MRKTAPKNAQVKLGCHKTVTELSLQATVQSGSRGDARIAAAAEPRTILRIEAG